MVNWHRSRWLPSVLEDLNPPSGILMAPVPGVGIQMMRVVREGRGWQQVPLAHQLLAGEMWQTLVMSVLISGVKTSRWELWRECRSPVTMSHFRVWITVRLGRSEVPESYEHWEKVKVKWMVPITSSMSIIVSKQFVAMRTLVDLLASNNIGRLPFRGIC
jgi:hypothetical protein